MHRRELWIILLIQQNDTLIKFYTDLFFMNVESLYMCKSDYL